jgi:superfamily II DNA or RNA helicase
MPTLTKKEAVAVSSGMVRVPLSLVEDRLSQIRSDLTFHISDGANFGGGEAQLISVVCFKEDEESIEVPRHYFRKKFSDLKVEDRTTQGDPIKVKFKGTLWETEKKNQVAASVALCGTDGGILAVACAYGKTVLSIHAAIKRGRKTLVVVPTSFLLGQWIDRLTQFTDLKKEDIGIVQGPRCEWENKPFIIGMIQSLYDHDRPEAFYQAIGTIILDEVHLISAREFLKAVPKFPAKVRWGLSATPKRKDGLHKALEHHVGPIVYQHLDQELRATVWMVPTGIALKHGEMFNPWNGQFNYARVFSALAKNERRNKILAHHLARAYKADHKILLLSIRNEQFSVLNRMLEANAVPANRMGKIVGEGKLTPEIIEQRIKILREKRIIFANRKIAGMGLDEPSLDTLFFGLPIQEVEQPCGRVTRSFAGKDDFSPLVLDLIDDGIPQLKSMSLSRKKSYERLGYRVKNAA